MHEEHGCQERGNSEVRFDWAADSEADSDPDLSADSDPDVSADSETDSAAHCVDDHEGEMATRKYHFPKQCWNCGLHHFQNLTNFAQIQGDQVRQDLYFLAINLNQPAEKNAESHDWDGRGHTDHVLRTSHCHWKTRTLEERGCLEPGD